MAPWRRLQRRLPQGHPLSRIRCRARRLNMPGQAARAVGVDALAARPVVSPLLERRVVRGAQPAAVAAARPIRAASAAINSTCTTTARTPGQLYENGGNGRGGANRGIITYKGQVVQLMQGARPQTIGCVGDAYELRGVWNPNDWNQIHIIARGGTLIHIVNGRVITISLDEDPTIRKDKGLLAVQIEGSPVESDLTASFRNIWLRNW